MQVDGCYHLKTFLNIAGPDVLSVGAGPEAQSVLKRMEREATHRYQTLTLPEDRAANCMFVNGTLVHRGRQEAPKSQPVSLHSLAQESSPSNLTKTQVPSLFPYSARYQR